MAKHESPQSEVLVRDYYFGIFSVGINVSAFSKKNNPTNPQKGNMCFKLRESHWFIEFHNFFFYFHPQFWATWFT